MVLIRYWRGRSSGSPLEAKLSWANSSGSALRDPKLSSLDQSYGEEAVEERL
jgi:hypothetical protein